jgi:hypothetical protein
VFCVYYIVFIDRFLYLLIVNYTFFLISGNPPLVYVDNSNSNVTISSVSKNSSSYLSNVNVCIIMHGIIKF